MARPKDKYKTSIAVRQAKERYRATHKEQIKERSKKYYEKNKKARLEYGKIYDRANKTIRKGHYLKYKYNISIVQYNELFTKQKGICAICGKPEIRIIKGTVCNLCVDHNHETGKVRGLLCFACNLRVGFFEEDTIIDKVIKYLKGSKI